MFDQILLIAPNDLINLPFWQEIWFKVGTAAALVTGACVFYKVRVGKLKNQRAELTQQVHERSELLAYALENEQKAREETKQANLTKRELLTRISREIRTPMNGVIGMASLLSETQLTPEQREYSETVLNCGESLLTSINDILLDDVLAYSKLESGKMELEQKDFNLRNSIEEVLDVFGSKAAQSGVELLYQLDPKVPPVIIGDSERVRQILMNLVENAVQSTVHGEVLVKVQLMKVLPENALELVFEVSDTGPGILPNRMNALTKELTQSDSKRSQHDSDVGFTICKKLVALMGGRISIETKVGIGTTVRFTICTRASVQPLRNLNLQSMEGKKILIVDENAAGRIALKDQIEQWKVVTVTTPSGKEALEILSKTADFDLVLTDMRMPEMNGASLAEAVRELYPQLPIILLSTESEDNSRKYKGLFHAVVSKPIKQHVLREQILSGLRHPGETPTAEVQPVKQKLSGDFSQQFPLRILIAEDDRVNQKLATKILSKLGYSPDIAQNGKEVLEMVGQVNYDLILMDVQMPEMDGLEATRMIRLCLSSQPVVVAMTANSQQGDRDACLQAGMDDYLSKPIYLEELTAVLEKWAIQVNDEH